MEKMISLESTMQAFIHSPDVSLSAPTCQLSGLSQKQTDNNNAAFIQLSLPFSLFLSSYWCRTHTNTNTHALTTALGL